MHSKKLHYAFRCGALAASLTCLYSQIQDPWSLGDAPRKLMLERMRTDLLKSGKYSVKLPVSPDLSDLLSRNETESKAAALDAYRALGNERQAIASGATATMQETYHTERVKEETDRKRRTALDILATAEQWRPGKGFERLSEPVAELEDPFASTGKKTPAESSKQVNWQANLAELGMAWDTAHNVVRIHDDSPSFWEAAKIRPRSGDYPVLSDGSLLDSAETLQAFLKNLSIPTTPIIVMRDETVVNLRVEVIP